MKEALPLRFKVGRVIIIVAGLLFMTVGIVIGLNPLPGEEGEYCRMTFDQLDASNPRLADIVWHLNTAIATMAFGMNLLVVILAWRFLPRRSVFAWTMILALNLIFVASLLMAHFALFLRHGMEFNHWFLPFSVAMIQATGLFLVKKPVFTAAAPP